MVQGVSPLKSFKVGAEVKVKVIGYRALDANKLVFCYYRNTSDNVFSFKVFLHTAGRVSHVASFVGLGLAS